MKITGENLEVLAAKAYTNAGCLSTEEFLEDLLTHKLIKKLARKIEGNGNKTAAIPNTKKMTP